MFWQRPAWSRGRAVQTWGKVEGGVQQVQGFGCGKRKRGCWPQILV